MPESSTQQRVHCSNLYLFICLMQPSFVMSRATRIHNPHSQTPAPLTAVQAGFYCGTSWSDVTSKCKKNCPSGEDTDCPGGETCFAFTGCKEDRGWGEDPSKWVPGYDRWGNSIAEMVAQMKLEEEAEAAIAAAEGRPAEGSAGGNDAEEEPLCRDVRVTITADNWPQETTWKIIDTDTGNDVIAGDGEDLVPGEPVSEELCLPSWACYRFAIEDAGGGRAVLRARQRHVPGGVRRGDDQVRCGVPRRGDGGVRVRDGRADVQADERADARADAEADEKKGRRRRDVQQQQLGRFGRVGPLGRRRRAPVRAESAGGRGVHRRGPVLRQVRRLLQRAHRHRGRLVLRRRGEVLGRRGVRQRAGSGGRSRGPGGDGGRGSAVDGGQTEARNCRDSEARNYRDSEARNCRDSREAEGDHTNDGDCTKATATAARRCSCSRLRSAHENANAHADETDRDERACVVDANGISNDNKPHGGSVGGADADANCGELFTAGSKNAIEEGTLLPQ